MDGTKRGQKIEIQRCIIAEQLKQANDLLPGGMNIQNAVPCHVRRNYGARHLVGKLSKDLFAIHLYNVVNIMNVVNVVNFSMWSMLETRSPIDHIDQIQPIDHIKILSDLVFLQKVLVFGRVTPAKRFIFYQFLDLHDPIDDLLRARWATRNIYIYRDHFVDSL